MQEKPSKERTQKSKPRWRRIITGTLIRLFFIFSSLAIGLGIFEGYLRLSMPSKPDLSLSVFDFELGKRLRPMYKSEIHYGVPVEINSRGMRDREFELKKPPGGVRIIVLGDSWTIGLGVQPEETWPKRLEAVLNANSIPAEVLNTGVSGYETYHEALYYKRDLGKFEHDIVLVGMYPVNDVHNKVSRYKKYKALHDIHPLLLKAYLFPEKHLYLAHWYKQWRKDRTRQKDAEFYAEQKGSSSAPSRGEFAPGEEDWTLLYNDDNAGWRLMGESLKSIGETAAACGARGAVVLFPDLRDLVRYKQYCHPRVAPLIEKAALEAGLGFIDLADDFGPYANRENELAIGSNLGASHPNARGYDLIARSVVRDLLARGLLHQKSK